MDVEFWVHDDSILVHNPHSCCVNTCSVGTIILSLPPNRITQPTKKVISRARREFARSEVALETQYTSDIYFQ